MADYRARKVSTSGWPVRPIHRRTVRAVHGAVCLVDAAGHGTSVGPVARAPVGVVRPGADRRGGRDRSDSGADTWSALAAGRARVVRTVVRGRGRRSNSAFSSKGSGCRPTGGITAWASLRWRGGDVLRRVGRWWPNGVAGAAASRRRGQPPTRSAGGGEPRAVRAVRTGSRGRLGLLHGDQGRVRRDPAPRAGPACCGVHRDGSRGTAHDRGRGLRRTSPTGTAGPACLWRGRPPRSPSTTAARRRRRPMRLIWTLDAGFPAPMCNRAVFDLDGNLLGYPDLLDPVAGLVGEYDGADHRSAERHGADVAREELFRDHGIEYFTVVGADLAHLGLVVARMQRARARAKFLPPESRPGRSTRRRGGPVRFTDSPPRKAPERMLDSCFSWRTIPENPLRRARGRGRPRRAATCTGRAGCRRRAA